MRILAKGHRQNRKWRPSALYSFRRNFSTLRVNYELILPPDASLQRQRKQKRSHAQESQPQRNLAVYAQRGYTTDDMLNTARNFLKAQHEEWVNFSRVSQCLYERFYNLKPKRLGEPRKKYKSLLKFFIDHPADFTIRQDKERRGIYWVRLGSL
jgi:hypothetical protein